MLNRFSCLVAGLSVSLIVSSGCTQWGNLRPPQDVADRSADPAKSDVSRPLSADASKNGFAHVSETTDQPSADGKQAQTQRPTGNGEDNAFLLGRRAEDAGQLEEARQQYQNVLRKYPTHAYAHHRLGVVADKMQRFAEAERHYQTALKYLSPDNRQEISIVFSDLGYSYLLRGDFARSERALTNSLAYDTNSRIAKRNLALLYGYRGNFQQAYQTFASVGGDAEARAEMDRLFPDWQSNVATAPKAQPTDQLSAPIVAMTSARPAQSDSAAFPTRQTAESNPFPNSAQNGNSPLSQHLTFDMAPENNSPMAARAESIADAPPKMLAQTTASPEPLQAPRPTGNPIDNAQAGYTDAPSAALVDGAQPTNIAHATYTLQQTSTAPAGQKRTPDIAVHVDDVSPAAAINAGRAALILGGAIGMGGMFPTTQIEALPVRPAATPPRQPHVSGSSTSVIQQMSAEVPSQASPLNSTPNQFPTSAASQAIFPTNAPAGVPQATFRSTNSAGLNSPPNVSEIPTVRAGDSGRSAQFPTQSANPQAQAAIPPGVFAIPQ